MNEDIYTVCGRCMVKISGPTSEVVNTAFRGHEKEAHGYMTGQEWSQRTLTALESIRPELSISDKEWQAVLNTVRKAAQ